MRVVHERCAGLDVHKSSVVACALLPEGKQLRTFGTLTWQLEQLAQWLQGLSVGVVAMESSGVYWKPVFNILEAADFELLVVNARHIKAVPGRKTDVKDAEWIADLLRHGLLKPSLIPRREQRELRELTRYQRTLIEERAHEVQRLQKVLEGANIKLEDVISNVVGLNGRRFLSALIPGNNESAGKRRSGYAGKGNRWLRSILVESAWCASRKKDSYFKVQYHRLAARRGRKRALLAVSHSLLTVIYHLLNDGVVYQDLGPNYFDQRDRSQITRQAVRRLERLGYHVSLTEGAA